MFEFRLEVRMALKYDFNLEVRYPPETILGQISDETRQALLAAWSEKAYAGGQIILDADDEGDDMLFLLEGGVRIANFSSKGREVSFSDIVEGDCFGEFAVIDGAPRSASVLATRNARIAIVPGPVFLELMQAHPDLGMALMRTLVERLRDLTRRVSEFTAMKADDRIRLELLRLFEGGESADGSAFIASPPTQSSLASFVFTNREAVAREIGRMKRKGLIERRGRAMYAPSVADIAAYHQQHLED